VGSVIRVGVVDDDDNILVEMELVVVLAGVPVDVPRAAAAVDEGGVIADGCCLLEDRGIM
jgi:hypothetical protein